MSETTQVVTETVQPQVVTTTPAVTDNKALQRLSEEFPEDVKIITTPTTETTTPVVTEPTAEEKTALADKAKELGLPETATKEEIEIAEKAKTDETTWKLNEVTPSAEEEVDGTWKGLAEMFELGELPADYSEEKGFETIQNMFKSKLDAVKQEAIKESSYDRFTDVPEPQRAEAEMYVELMKTGKTMAEINEPFTELAQFKALSKEEVVREGLMFRFRNDEEVVDNKMAKIIEDGKLDSEYREAMIEVDNEEKRLLAVRQQQVDHFKNNQAQIKEQKFNQENVKLKHALGGVQEYLGKKLTPEVKSLLETELTSGKFHSMDGTPEEKVDYLLYKKFGKAGIASFQARALEKVVLQNKIQQHNVPIVNSNGNANRTEIGGEMTEAQRRLVQEFGT